MLVREIMNSCISECTEDTSLEKVYELIQKSADGFVVVIDSEAHRVPIGIVTEHTICEQIIRKGRQPRTLNAGNVMNSRIVKLNSDGIADGLSNMLDDSRTSPFIVVNDKRELCGVLSPKALHRSFAAETAERPLRHDVVPNIGVRELPAFGWA